MDKEKFLEMFAQCVKDGNIVLVLEENYEYDNYKDIYPRLFIYNSNNEEIYDSRDKFINMGVSVKC